MLPAGYNLAPTIVAVGGAPLQLKNDTGGLPPDNVTADPTVVGTIDNDGNKDGLVVLLDFDGDGISDAQTATDASGHFEYTPPGLSDGDTIAVCAKVKEWDALHSRYLISRGS